MYRNHDNDLYHDHDLSHDHDIYHDHDNDNDHDDLDHKHDYYVHDNDDHHLHNLKKLPITIFFTNLTKYSKKDQKYLLLSKSYIITLMLSKNIQKLVFHSAFQKSFSAVK
jgi:hypothetical protein